MITCVKHLEIQNFAGSVNPACGLNTSIDGVKMENFAAIINGF